ncbi:MAG: N-6 DNA methylase [Opitutaceae bacterium]|nr:N-6 DNA methylase [Opitutaceae bacterium]
MAPSDTPATFESFQAELARLVAQFDRQHPGYTTPDYLEASLRADFLDPFFRALGWDVGNQKGLIHTEREVAIEVRTHLSGKQTRADYVFRHARTERFTCEAKKPAEVLHNRHILQAKKDAFARGVPLALLSDFEELKIYVVGARPLLDEPHVGEWKVLHFKQYPAAARELWDLLAYENVSTGSIDRLIESLPKRPLRLQGRQGYLIKPDRTRALDADFLNFLDGVRQQLGSDLLKHNDRADLLEGHRLNEAAQRIIDRLVFLRICEDRGIDTGTLLQTLFDGWYRQQPEAAKPKLRQPGKQTRLRFGGAEEEPPAAGYGARGRTEGGLYRELTDHIRALDQRPPSYKPFFNGQLFKPHFSEELTVGDEWLANFLLDLVDDDNGYNFADIKVEILGDAYERFLGKILRPQGRGATIEEKPEVRKAGGVYYTPRYITDYIVEQTVGRLLAGRTPKQAEKLRIVDPACGSGSFLLRAYEEVMAHHLRWFTANPDKRRKEDCYVDAAGDVRLTTALKRRILENNIHGVDIDAQAVEVTQLSLYLKMLEGENRETLRTQTELFRNEPLLPPLDRNIKSFNSLIASDFSLDPAELVRVNAGDWDVQFPEIMQAGGFDAVIGNPPYVRIQTLNETDSASVEYLGRRYAAARSGNYDLYVVFIERALALLNLHGRFGYIVPHKFFNAKYGEAIRDFLSSGGHVSGIVHFGHQQIFDGATTYTCLLFLQRTAQHSFEYTPVSNLRQWRAQPRAVVESISAGTLTAGDWVIAGGARGSLLARLQSIPLKLDQVTKRIFQGIKTSADKIYIVEERSRSKRTVKIWSPQLKREFELESDLLHPLIKGGDSRRYSMTKTDRLILFPYEKHDGAAALIDSKDFAKRFPHTWEYLLANKSYLENREDGKMRGSGWYAFGRTQALDVMPLPKIFTPDIAPCPAFSHDASGECFFTGGVAGGYGILPIDDVAPQVLLALLNSDVLGWIVAQTATQMRGGYFSFEARFIRNLPIVLPAKGASTNRLVALVDKMLTLTPALRVAKSDAEKAALQNALTKTDREIDQLVYQLYGLTPEEIALVEGNAPAS